MILKYWCAVSLAVVSGAMWCGKWEDHDSIKSKLSYRHPIQIICHVEAVEKGYVTLYDERCKRMDNAELNALLYAAMQVGACWVAEIAEKYGAVLNYAQSELNSLLKGAVERNLTEVAERLLKQGANLHYESGILLHFGNLATLKWLTNHGLDVNLQDDSGCTALHRAVEKGSRSRVQKLLAVGANPLICNKAGRLPIQSLFKYSDDGIRLLLMEAMVTRFIQKTTNDAQTQTETVAEELPLPAAPRSDKQRAAR